MMSIKGSMREMEELEDFHEAAWVFKRNGIYYLTYADNLEDNNHMRYATSDHPLGPWTYRGIFLEPTGCLTTHGSVAEFKGQWYLFYHNQELSGEGTLRSVCIDELYFNDDGTIRTVVQTREGVKPVGETPLPNPETKTYQAADSTAGGGAVIEAYEEGKSVVSGLNVANAHCRFRDVDGGAKGGRAEIRLQYATAEPLAKLQLTVNGKDYSLLNAPSTGENTAFTGCTGLTVQLEAGSGNLITWTGGKGDIRIGSMTVSPLGD
ncbi:family 43 glycosylhydrolase [Paenibacillus sp. P3E]|uniref:family 43 glycosylhydrolase n=1 Tax=Paenibacillus sp. P3E TaxID=1349435 RepID=UPI00093FFA96|nr:family 43 glycosylhydrolase [Paenibacillus sp. P3E]